MDPAKNSDKNGFSKKVSLEEKRKLKALAKKGPSVWSGLGMMGMVGWSVAVPALIGAALGKWMDASLPQSFSWTLSLLFVGLITGSVIAWYWVANEDKEMHEDDNTEEHE